MAKKKDDFSMYLLGIVAIVAAVGIYMMVSGGNSYVSETNEDVMMEDGGEETNLVGQVIHTVSNKYECFDSDDGLFSTTAGVVAYRKKIKKGTQKVWSKWYQRRDTFNKRVDKLVEYSCLDNGRLTRKLFECPSGYDKEKMNYLKKVNGKVKKTTAYYCLEPPMPTVKAESPDSVVEFDDNAQEETTTVVIDNEPKVELSQDEELGDINIQQLGTKVAVDGALQPHYLYFAKEEGDNGVYICPEASGVYEVTPSCTEKISYSTEDCQGSGACTIENGFYKVLVDGSGGDKDEDCYLIEIKECFDQDGDGIKESLHNGTMDSCTDDVEKEGFADCNNYWSQGPMKCDMANVPWSETPQPSCMANCDVDSDIYACAYKSSGVYEYRKMVCEPAAYYDSWNPVSPQEWVLDCPQGATCYDPQGICA
ncbi:hypothetical protein HN695_01835 [Candidatus Woesearchaeota archaeon]|jgi:hypothetical protein|nr:hypothetical protein [Candidatus Woesearchaeota archaeon]MBT5273139.1 hypothetical protein [Candidatus Woesearchaeota archaeon]MBT6041628.1 hypothetical protein [Candidatus Woesearchaeota archaeon]MBT6337546.1 hypothetical protein [Candidatus Woesearchaeota archaeon]MBT7927053.1 hypothetical protein [Candidatus Woesearchaeota archaeon]